MSKLLKSVLKRNGISSSTKKNLQENKASNTRLKESDILMREVNSLVENAAKESMRTVIKESAMSADDKLSSIEAIEKPLTEQEINFFIGTTIDPILETVGNINNGCVFKSKNPKLRGINLAIYETALTLDAARRGVLTLESLEDKAVSDEPAPTADEVASFADQVDPGPITDEEGAVGKSAEEDAMGIADIVDQTLDPTYNFGAVEENTVEDMMGTDQNEEFDAQGDYSQDYRHEDEPDFENDGDIETYEGEEAGNPDDGLFDKPMVKENYRKLSRYLQSIREEFEGDSDTTDEVVPDFEDAEDIQTYRGEEAGKPPYDPPADEFTGDGNCEDAAIEEQVSIAKNILNRIFAEYGVKENSMKKKIVKEALHYLGKYGSTSLVPAYSDVAHLVIDQNRLSENNMGPESRVIVEATKPTFKKSHVRSINEKCEEIVNAAINAHRLAEGGLIREANILKRAIIENVQANEIERRRQAFRYRMSRFNESSKQYVLNGWGLVESGTPKSKEIESEIKIRDYVAEGTNLFKHLKSLGENNPLAVSEIKKTRLNVDNLVTASIMTEAAISWTKIKKSLYNGTSLEHKFIALETMLGALTRYKTLCTAIYNKPAATTVLEGFEYRLNALKDKVVKKLGS